MADDEKQQKKRGPKPHVPTEQTRRTVINLAARGVPTEEIAQAIGIGNELIRKLYTVELGRGPGRPAHVPTDQTRGMVRLLVAYLIPRDEIAQAVGCGRDALMANYKEELESGRSWLKSEIVRMLSVHLMGRPAQYNAAGKQVREEIKPSERMAIFQGRAVLGLQDNARGFHVLTPDQLGLLDDDEFQLYARIIEKIASAQLGISPPREITQVN